MSEILETKQTSSLVITARVCDICKFTERSDEETYRFPSESLGRWSMLQLTLDDYTQPSNNRWFHACSPACTRALLKKMAEMCKHENDRFGGMPTKYIKDIIGEG